jgi:hypothetical protein
MSQWIIQERSSSGVTVPVPPRDYIVFFKIHMIYLKTKVMAYGWKYKDWFAEELDHCWCSTSQHTVQAGKRTIQWTLGQRSGMIGQIAKLGLPNFYADKPFWNVENIFYVPIQDRYVNCS